MNLTKEQSVMVKADRIIKEAEEYLLDIEYNHRRKQNEIIYNMRKERKENESIAHAHNRAMFWVYVKGAIRKKE